MFEDPRVFCPECGEECIIIKEKIDCETCNKVFDLPEQEPDWDWLNYLEEKITEEWRASHGY